MKTILAYRFSAFGDVAMTVPVFREFLEQNPEIQIVMVSREYFAPLFQNLPRFHFHGVDLSKYKGATGLYRLGRELLHNFQFESVADFHDVIRSKALDFYFKSKGFEVFKLDKGKDEKERLTDIWNIEKKPLKRTVERYADVFRQMGYSLVLEEKLKSICTDKQGVGFAPFARHKGKMLPLEKSFQLAQELSKFSKVFFFGGGKKEEEILNIWEKKIPHSQSLAGKLSLDEELKKIAELKLMISMDSANMHLASLVGTRCISIWGATHPYAGFLGYGQSEEDVVQIKDLTCRPCSVFGDKKCYRGDWACLEEISIQQILDKI